MNKREIIHEVAGGSGLTLPQTTEIVETVFKLIADELSDGREVQIHGLGNFSFTDRKASRGRNPKTGEEIAIAARRGVKFKPFKTIRDSLNPQRMVPRQPARKRA